MICVTALIRSAKKCSLCKPAEGYLCYFKFAHALEHSTKADTEQDIYSKDIILTLSWGVIKCNDFKNTSNTVLFINEFNLCSFISYYLHITCRLKILYDFEHYSRSH